MAPNKILLVDDEADFAKLVKIRLEANKYDVMVAKDGEEALAKAETYSPDLIILDLMLPAMSGYDVCRKLKLDEKLKTIPIVVLTAKFQPNDITFCKALGADGYITKPAEPEVLLGEIRKYLK